MQDKYVQVANDFNVIVSEFNGTVMLELRGQFKPQRLSVNKVNFVIRHGNKLAELIESPKEGLYNLSVAESVFVDSFQGTTMLELRGEFRPQRISENKVRAIIHYSKELKSIISDNTVQAIVTEKIVKATKELKQNSASIGTDRKSAKDSSDSYIALAEKIMEVTPVTFSGHSTIAKYLSATYPQFTKEDVEFYSVDMDAMSEYQEYLKRVTRPSFKDAKAVQAPVPVMKKVFKDAKQDAPKTSEYKTVGEYQQAKKGTTKKDVAPVEKKGRGIPVSFSVRMGGKDRDGLIEDNQTRAINSLVGKKLERVSVHNGEEQIDTKIITSVPTGSSPSHYWKELQRQRYVFNVKELQ